MQSLREHKALLYSILASGGAVFALAAGALPDLAEQFEIVDFPAEVKLFMNFLYLINKALPSRIDERLVEFRLFFAIL